jgi:hypothetical protein
VLDREGRGRRVAVDLGGGMIGFFLFEGSNAGVRAICDALELSDTYRAYLQGVPHFIIGNVVYAIELATRDTKRPVGMGREILSEASKNFAEYGMSTAFRAWRVGAADKRSQSDAKDQQIEDLKAKLAATSK